MPDTNGQNFATDTELRFVGPTDHLDRRYVIQEHRKNGMVHFDLMFEVLGWDLLRTFQIPEAPEPLRVSFGLVCREIARHRRKYLGYEGPLSDGRGEVKIWDSGTIRLSKETSHLLMFELLSARERSHPVWVMHFTGGADWHMMSPNLCVLGSFKGKSREGRRLFR